MDKAGKTFVSICCQHLYRHKSEVYYARVTVNRKKTWRNLRTRTLDVARSELAELLREERENREFNDALETHEALSLGQVVQKMLERVLEGAFTKEFTKKYQHEICDAFFSCAIPVNKIS